MYSQVSSVSSTWVSASMIGIFASSECFDLNPGCVVDDFQTHRQRKRKFYVKREPFVIRNFTNNEALIFHQWETKFIQLFEPAAVQELRVFSLLVTRETGAPFLPLAAPAQSLLQTEVRRLTRRTYTLQTRE